VELAERACQLTEWKAPFLMGTLAAAYAQAGRFANAVAMAERAQARAQADKLDEVAKRNGELLELYRAGKPYHEKAEAPKHQKTESLGDVAKPGDASSKPAQ
jgi:protein O-mannosyl-transferase